MKGSMLTGLFLLVFVTLYWFPELRNYDFMTDKVLMFCNGVVFLVHSICLSIECIND